MSARDIVVTQIGDHILHIPKGYVDSFLGYAGYVQIHALLPCLEPETTANTAEFHRVDPGKILTATLNAWASNYLDGKQLLEAHIGNSKFVQKATPSTNKITIGPIEVNGTEFIEYKDILIDLDIFERRNHSPLLLLECNMNAKFLISPLCYVTRHIFGDVRLQYRYSRVYIDQDINISIDIDNRLLRLLSSFVVDTTVHERSRRGEN